MNNQQIMEEIFKRACKEPLIARELKYGKQAVLSKEEKIEKIAGLFSDIMSVLGLDLTDDSLKGTPVRVAKMYVNEAFSGLDVSNKPSVSAFENSNGYNQMLVVKDITLYSHCEHHFVPIIGKVHIAYMPHHYIIGLSKINRLVQYYAKRPQVQERLTVQIAEGLKEALGHPDVAIYIEAEHLCVAARGIKDTNSLTVTEHYCGIFKEEQMQHKFLAHIKS